MIPKPGQFFASRSDSLIGKGIQKAEKIREKRIKHYKDTDVFWNHIGMFVEKDGVLCIGEALIDGFKIHPWKGSEYETKKTEYIICELYKPFDEYELLLFNHDVLKLEGLPYDFEGIADSLDFALTGVWKGKKNIEARNKMFCSEVAATAVNDIRKGIFPQPWTINPQMFIENPNIVVLKKQPYYEKNN